MREADVHVQELSTKVADLKSQASDRTAPHRVSFAPQDQPSPSQQYQQQPPHLQQPQYQQVPQQQDNFGGQPALMWEQSSVPANMRQSGSWARPQTGQGSPGDIAGSQQLPQLLQKLQKTQEKLESRDASARKYKVSQLFSHSLVVP